MINGISVQRLEEIELRLVGADHRPWAMSPPASLDDEGRRSIMKGSQKAAKKACQKAAQVGREKIAEGGDKWTKKDRDQIKEWEKDGPIAHGPTLRAELALFHRTHNATDDMLEFIVHAPEDVELLLREIRQMHIIATKAKEERDAAVQELQRTKIAASRAEEKIVDMRRAWRTLVKEMGTKP